MNRASGYYWVIKDRHMLDVWDIVYYTYYPNGNGIWSEIDNEAHLSDKDFHFIGPKVKMPKVEFIFEE